MSSTKIRNNFTTVELIFVVVLVAVFLDNVLAAFLAPVLAELTPPSLPLPRRERNHLSSCKLLITLCMHSTAAARTAGSFAHRAGNRTGDCGDTVGNKETEWSVGGIVVEIAVSAICATLRCKTRNAAEELK